MAHRYLWGPNVPAPQRLPATRTDAPHQSPSFGASPPTPQRLPVFRAGAPLVDAIVPVPPVPLTSASGSVPVHPLLPQDPIIPILDPPGGRTFGSSDQDIDADLFRELMTPEIPWLLGDITGAPRARPRGEPSVASLGVDDDSQPTTGRLHDDYFFGGEVADDWIRGTLDAIANATSVDDLDRLQGIVESGAYPGQAEILSAAIHDRRQHLDLRPFYDVINAPENFSSGPPWGSYAWRQFMEGKLNAAPELPGGVVIDHGYAFGKARDGGFSAFVVPNRMGARGLSEFDPFFHSYFAGETPTPPDVQPQMFGLAVQTPTAGPDNLPASAAGTINDVGPAADWVPFQRQQNWVESFYVDAPDPFRDYILNYTMHGKHLGDEGFVMRGYDEKGNFVSHGEGTTWRMRGLPGWFAADVIERYWSELNRAQLEEALRAQGLYPRPAHE